MGGKNFVDANYRFIAADQEVQDSPGRYQRLHRQTPTVLVRPLSADSRP